MAKIITLEDICKHISSYKDKPPFTLNFSIEEGRKLPSIKKLWGEYLFEECLTHFPALRGAAKSLLMLQICIAISSYQKEFLGEKIEINGKTLYVDFEMPESFIQRRSTQLFDNCPFPMKGYLDNVIILSTRKPFEKVIDLIITLLKQEKPVLLVIDNLRTALKNTNANSAVDMINFFSILGGMRELFKCAIVVVDHTKKGTRHLKTDSDAQSGSGAKTDLVDSDFQIRHSCQDKNLRLIKRIKSRMFAESDETKLVRLNPDSLWFELIQMDCNESEHIGLSHITEKEEMIDIAKDLKKQGKSYLQIAAALSKPKTTIYRWLGKDEES